MLAHASQNEGNHLIKTTQARIHHRHTHQRGSRGELLRDCADFLL